LRLLPNGEFSTSPSIITRTALQQADASPNRLVKAAGRPLRASTAMDGGSSGLSEMVWNY